MTTDDDRSPKNRNSLIKRDVNRLTEASGSAKTAGQHTGVTLKEGHNRKTRNDLNSKDDSLLTEARRMARTVGQHTDAMIETTGKKKQATGQLIGLTDRGIGSQEDAKRRLVVDCGLDGLVRASKVINSFVCRQD